MGQSEWTAQMRAAMTTFWLQRGDHLTTAEIARLCGVTWKAARYMLSNLSLVLPIAEDEEGRWYWVRDHK